MKNNILILIIAGVVIIAVGTVVWNGTPSADAMPITVYKSPSCGCCGNYAAYLKGKDFAPDIVERWDTEAVKAEFGVPMELESCHTSVVDGYVVEGHIPTEVIRKLLEEKPDIAGIALAGMPSGSPGMPGAKIGAFEIHKLTADGKDGGIFMNF